MNPFVEDLKRERCAVSQGDETALQRLIAGIRDNDERYREVRYVHMLDTNDEGEARSLLEEHPEDGLVGYRHTIAAGYFRRCRVGVDDLHSDKPDDPDPVRAAWSRFLSGPLRLKKYRDSFSELAPAGAVWDGISEHIETVAAVNGYVKDCFNRNLLVDPKLELFGMNAARARDLLGPTSRHPTDLVRPADITLAIDETALTNFDKRRADIAKAACEIVSSTGASLRPLFRNLDEHQDSALFRVLVVDDFYPLLYPWFDRMAALEPWQFEFWSDLPRRKDQFKLKSDSRVDLEALAERLGTNRADAPPWHLVLLDVDFGWQGYGNVALDYLRALKKLLPKTPVLIVSRWSYLDSAEPFRTAGAAGYLSKRATAYVEAETEQFRVSTEGYDPDTWVPEHWRTVMRDILRERWSVKQIWVPAAPPTMEGDGNTPLAVGRTILVDEKELPSIAYLRNWSPNPTFDDWSASSTKGDSGLQLGAPEVRHLTVNSFVSEMLRSGADVPDDETIERKRTAAHALVPKLATIMSEEEARRVSHAALPLLRSKGAERYLLVPLEEFSDESGRIAVLIRTPVQADDETYYRQKLVWRLQAGAPRAGRTRTDRTRRLLAGLWKDLHYLVVSDFSLLTLFDVFGPDMSGPSSSHTAGACRIGRLARNWLLALNLASLRQCRLRILMHGSFRTTGEGHRSDFAVLGGLRGWLPSAGMKSARERFHMPKRRPEDGRPDEGTWDDDRFPGEVEIVWNDLGQPHFHPNTIAFELTGDADSPHWFACRSWGGGNVQVTGIGRGDTRSEIPQSLLDDDKKSFAGLRPIQVCADCSVREEGDQGVFVIRPTVEFGGRGKEIRLATNLADLACTSDRISQGELLLRMEEAKSCCVQTDDPASKIVAVALRFNWSRHRAESTEQLLPPEWEIWRRALDYESWVTGREESAIRWKAAGRATATGGETDGQTEEPPSVDQEPILSVGVALDTMLRSIIEGLKASRAADKSKWESDAWRVLSAAPDLCSGRAAYAQAFALAVQQQNACGGRIIAAPTAGACGIVPGALFAAALEPHEIEALRLNQALSWSQIDEGRRRRMENAALTAAMVGLMINNIVPTSGATHGCQAETGVGAAMAAAAICQYRSDEKASLKRIPERVCHAAALALKNSIGLTCDPVAGRVEVPCIKRSAMKAAEALIIGESACAGLQSRIPPDEVVWVLKEAGEAMPEALKETSLGGLAQTLSARSNCPRCGEIACVACVAD